MHAALIHLAAEFQLWNESSHALLIADIAISRGMRRLNTGRSKNDLRGGTGKFIQRSLSAAIVAYSLR